MSKEALVTNRARLLCRPHSGTTDSSALRAYQLNSSAVRVQTRRYTRARGTQLRHDFRGGSTEAMTPIAAPQIAMLARKGVTVEDSYKTPDTRGPQRNARDWNVRYNPIAVPLASRGAYSVTATIREGPIAALALPRILAARTSNGYSVQNTNPQRLTINRIKALINIVRRLTLSVSRPEGRRRNELTRLVTPRI